MIEDLPIPENISVDIKRTGKTASDLRLSLKTIVYALVVSGSLLTTGVTMYSKFDDYGKRIQNLEVSVAKQNDTLSQLMISIQPLAAKFEAMKERQIEIDNRVVNRLDALQANMIELMKAKK